MKTITKITASFLLLFLSNPFYGQQFETDQVVALSTKTIDNTIYFNLEVLNETKNGFYSLVRFENDTTWESVKVIEAFANTINQPMLYSFHDEIIHDSDINYVLYRINSGRTTDIVMVWEYNDQTTELVEYMKNPTVQQKTIVQANETPNTSYSIN